MTANPVHHNSAKSQLARQTCTDKVAQLARRSCTEEPPPPLRICLVDGRPPSPSHAGPHTVTLCTNHNIGRRQQATTRQHTGHCGPNQNRAVCSSGNSKGHSPKHCQQHTPTPKQQSLKYNRNRNNVHCTARCRGRGMHRLLEDGASCQVHSCCTGCNLSGACSTRSCKGKGLRCTLAPR